VLLRHLSEVYKVLSQTVPPAAKTEDLIEAEAFFEDILCNVDSSLLDEWKKLRDPEYVPEEEKPAAERRAVAFSRNRTSFLRALRNAVFELVKVMARDDVAGILQLVEPADADGLPWTRQRLDVLLDGYFSGHERIRLDPEARAAKHTRISEEEPRRWIVEQALVDPEEFNDWQLHLAVDLDACDASGAVVLNLLDIRQV
jgi:plasmid stability protein